MSTKQGLLGGRPVRMLPCGHRATWLSNGSWAARVNFFPSHRCRLAANFASWGSHFAAIHTKASSTRSGSMLGRLGLNILFAGCCVVFSPCSHTHHNVERRVRHHTSPPTKTPLSLGTNSKLQRQSKSLQITKHFSSTKTSGFRGVRCFLGNLEGRITDDAPD